MILTLIRRAEENTSVAGQTSRELTLIKKEKERKKVINDKIPLAGFFMDSIFNNIIKTRKIPHFL